MDLISSGKWFSRLSAGALILPALSILTAQAANFGRVTGNVTDPQGNPLVGATVLLVGPMMPGSRSITAAKEHVITDARGKFQVEHLVPGWYSLRVTSPARLPSLRNGVKVQPGLTTRQSFVLTDIFTPLQLHPQGHVSFWGDDWKWVLRTSSSTRPVLRYRGSSHPAGRSKNGKAKDGKRRLPDGERLIGMMPGSSSHAPLAKDPGLGSVMAYLRPLSDDSDVLVSGSMAANGTVGSSVATAFRRNLTKGDPQEIAIAVHQLSFGEGLPVPAAQGQTGFTNAQGVVVSYTNARHLSDEITLTTGFQIDYLNSVREAMVAQPRAKLEYQVTTATMVSMEYGAANDAGGSTLLERVGELNSFPQVTLRGYRPSLESLNHGEVAVSHTLGNRSRVQLAAYHDSFQNAAVWGSGDPEELKWLAGAVLPNPAAQGLAINAGNYRSSGLRAAFAVRLTGNLEADVLYSAGDALATKAAFRAGAEARNLQTALRTAPTESVGGKVTCRIPASNTLLSASYLWLPHGRITSVDPYGQANLGMHPYLDVQVRQPLPNIGFIPARIEALADFRNLLEQGYVPLFGVADDPLLLSAAYRSFRGGFSVQF